MSEPVQIVASFPFPPKQFYENLTEEEILASKPPSFPTDSEKLIVFGLDQNLKIANKEELMLTEKLIDELKARKQEIFANYKLLLEGIDSVQDPSKVNEMIKLFDEPFQKVFDITSKLATIQAAVSLKKSLETDFEEIQSFLKQQE